MKPASAFVLTSVATNGRYDVRIRCQSEAYWRRCFRTPFMAGGDAVGTLAAEVHDDDRENRGKRREEGRREKEGREERAAGQSRHGVADERAAR